ncbi:MAG: type VI secretion system baseplate subunit TssG [Syntrophaceae bacterium]
MNELKQKISKRIHEFDIISLIRLLVSIGYSREEITFRSHNSICSQAGLIHSIEFRDDPVREALITMNMGLLGAQSPLPSYFRQKMESAEISGRSFADFIGYFDHHLIRDYICNIYPEINRMFFPDWELTKWRYLQILNLKALSTLHWLFQTVFPEIGVKVENAVLNSEVQTQPVRLGETILGNDAVFGNRTSVSLHGRLITLYSDEEMTDTQIPWPREIKNRIESLIFPVLKPLGIDLDIFLVLKSQKRWVRLHGETYLGYDRIRGEKDAYRRIHIFRGHIGEPFRAAENAAGIH